MVLARSKQPVPKHPTSNHPAILAHANLNVNSIANIERKFNLDFE